MRTHACGPLAVGAAMVIAAGAVHGQAPDMPVPVRAVAVQEGSSGRSTTQPATILPFYEAAIRAKVSGYISDIKADIGDAVKAGDSLAVLDIPEMEQQLAVVQAKIVRLHAEEQRAAAGIELSKSQVQSARAQLQQVESEAAKADAHLAADDSEFRRVSELVSRKSIEPGMLDEITKRRDASAAGQLAARSAIGSARALIAVAESQQAAAQASLAVAEAETQIAAAELNELNVMVNYGTLTAPFDGIVTHRTANPGNLVVGLSPAIQQPLFVVSQISKVRCRVSVPERDAALINRGDLLELTLPAFSGESISATVTRTSQSLDPETRSMLVEAEIPNAAGKLLPGMFGQATISTSTPTTANVLPARSVRFDESGKAFVYVITPVETIAVVPVTIGDDNGQRIEILAGVELGQRVVDAHLKRFTDGQPVRVVD